MLRDLDRDAVATTEQFKLKPDTLVGKWRIGRPLGSGGQGAVWVVRPKDTKNSPARALKASFATEAKDRARFKREAELLESCKSELVLTLHESHLTWAAHTTGVPEFAYYVSDLCEGSLEELKDQLIDAGVRLRLFIEACRGVQYIHGLPDPVIHRDIKPANFLIASEPRRVVLADLGIARYEAIESGLTVTHEVVGSKYYRPPEAMNGDPGSVRGDVYSLGRVLEWLLTGEVSTNFATRLISRGGDLADDLCDALDRAILKATQPIPENRFGSVAELLAQIPDRWLAIRPRVASIGLATPHDPESVATAAFDLIRKADGVGLRSLEHELRKSFPDEMLKWRRQSDAAPPDSEKQLLVAVDALWGATLGRIVFALTNVASGNSSFMDQQRVPEDLLTIPGWQLSGRTILTRAPRGLVYLFHYLHGALCIELHRPDLALNIATIALPQHDRDAPQPLWKQHDFTTWPKLFNDNAEVAWKYLCDMYGRFSVLSRLFALPNDFQVGLASYSMLLLLFECATDSAEILKYPANQELRFDVTPMFATMPSEVVASAARRTVGDRAVVESVLTRTGTTRSDLVAVWPRVKAGIERSRGRRSPFAQELPLGVLA